MSTTTHDLESIRFLVDRLPFCAQQAMLFSVGYASQYLTQHSSSPTRMDPDSVSLLAVGRLEWLLRKTRHALAGRFNEDEFRVLMDCYQADLFFPDQLGSIASDLCDHLGVDLDDYEDSEVAELVTKLRALSSIERVTLADALEQAWHRGLADGMPPKDFLAGLGLELS